MALADLGGHDEGNAFDDKEFQCLDGLIATVGDRHAVGQARMLQVGPDDIHGAVVIDVAGEGVVVDRLMPIQGIHHHLHRIGKLDPLLVLPPPDVRQCGAVGASGGGVQCQEITFPYPGKPLADECHAVPLADGLGQAGDRRRAQCPIRRGLDYPLPPLHPVVIVPGDIGEDGEGQHIIDKGLVALEDLFKIPPEAGLLRHLLKEPDITIEPGHVLLRGGGSPRTWMDH